MILALSAMSAGWQAFLFVLAVLAFLAIVVFAVTRKPIPWEWLFLGAGLAFFVFVFAYNAVAAA